ncbi:hypothetical protein P5X00_36515 [Paraburkholderia sp. A2RO-4L]|uniref:hypothetical protein n=1 Tax=Paraburkholderia sp. A2RO-4L TaxID=3028374 RepID=UPI0032F9A11D|nr:hypothetical protein [Burkholderia vietnamiensis]
MNRTCSVKNVAVGVGLLTLLPVVLASVFFAVVGVGLASAEFFQLVGGKLPVASAHDWVFVVSWLCVVVWGGVVAYQALLFGVCVASSVVAICLCVRYLDWLTHTLAAYHQSSSFFGMFLVWHVPLWVHLAVLPVQLVEAVLVLALVACIAVGCWLVLQGICRLGAEARKTVFESRAAAE